MDKVDFPMLLATLETGFEDDTYILREAIERALVKTARAAARSGGKCSLDIKITLSPQKNGALHVGGAIKLSLKAPGTFPVQMFATREGKLLNEDPEQPRLPHLTAVGKDDVQ